MASAARTTTPQQRTLESRRSIAEEAREVIRRRYIDPGLSLEAVAREVCVSKRQIQRAFEAAGSKGFKWELSRVRVLAAAKLLRDNPRLTVSQVAERVGLRHRSHFAALFREHLGATPQQWRETWRARVRA